MIVATMTAEEFTRRMSEANERGIDVSGRTPQQIAVRFSEDIARQANQLGLQGHGVERVEFLFFQHPGTLDTEIRVNVVPKFRLKQPS